MKHFKQLLCVAVVFCAGCSGGSGYGGGGAAPAPSPPPAAGPTDFTTFVVAQFAASATNETATPVEVEATQFTFADQDNPMAFDPVISSAP